MQGLLFSVFDFIARNKDQEGMRGTAKGRKTRLKRLEKYYQDFLDVFVFDERDRADEFAFEKLGCWASRADTLMTSVENSKELAEIVVDLFDTIVCP